MCHGRHRQHELRPDFATAANDPRFSAGFILNFWFSAQTVDMVVSRSEMFFPGKHGMVIWGPAFDPFLLNKIFPLLADWCTQDAVKKIDNFFRKIFLRSLAASGKRAFLEISPTLVCCVCILYMTLISGLIMMICRLSGAVSLWYPTVSRDFQKKLATVRHKTSSSTRNWMMWSKTLQ